MMCIYWMLIFISILCVSACSVHCGHRVGVTLGRPGGSGLPQGASLGGGVGGGRKVGDGVAGPYG